jgi:hypothetical protein
MKYAVIVAFNSASITKFHPHTQQPAFKAPVRYKHQAKKSGDGCAVSSE